MFGYASINLKNKENISLIAKQNHKYKWNTQKYDFFKNFHK